MKTILLVEDDPHHQRWLVEELTEEGYHVVTTASGREALTLAKDEQPDLVVLDIFMPDMDGLDVLCRLMDLNPKLPVVIHTAYAGYQDDFTSWLADAYVVKSSDTRELKQEIASALRHRDEEASFSKRN